MEIEITKATTEDIPVIETMAGIVFRHTYRNILTKEQIEYMMEWMYSTDSLERQLKDGHNFFIARSEDIAYGYVSIQRERVENDTTIYHLHKLYVIPERQSSGIGNLLFENACQYVREDKTTPKARIELNVNRFNKAIEFYLKKGMKIASEGDFPIGSGYYMNDYVMSLEL